MLLKNNFVWIVMLIQASKINEEVQVTQEMQDFIKMMEENLNPDLMCLTMGFLPFSDYDFFFKNFPISDTLKSKCPVGYQTRGYGTSVQEYFNFNGPNQTPSTYFFPPTIQQFASFTLGKGFPFHFILYKNGLLDFFPSFFSITHSASQILVPSIESFFIQGCFEEDFEKKCVINIFHKSAELLFKEFGQIHLSCDAAHQFKIKTRLIHISAIKYIHSLSPSMHMFVNPNNSFYFIRFHKFNEKTTLNTYVCDLDDYPEMESFTIGMNLQNFYDNLVNNCGDYPPITFL